MPFNDNLSNMRAKRGTEDNAHVLGYELLQVLPAAVTNLRFVDFKELPALKTDGASLRVDFNSNGFVHKFLSQGFDYVGPDSQEPIDLCLLGAKGRPGLLKLCLDVR